MSDKYIQLEPQFMIGVRSTARVTDDEIEQVNLEYKNFLTSMQEAVYNIIEHEQKTKDFWRSDKLVLDENNIIYKLNTMMIDIVNQVDGDYKTFENYDKDRFNIRFDSMKKKYKYEIYGRCSSLRNLIETFKVEVDSTGYEMLLSVINRFEKE